MKPVLILELLFLITFVGSTTQKKINFFGSFASSLQNGKRRGIGFGPIVDAILSTKSTYNAESQLKAEGGLSSKLGMSNSVLASNVGKALSTGGKIGFDTVRKIQNIKSSNDNLTSSSEIGLDTNTSVDANLNTNLNTNAASDLNLGTNLNAASDLNTNLNTNVTSDLNTDLKTDLNTNLNAASDLNTNLNTNLNTHAASDLNTNLNAATDLNLGTNLNTNAASDLNLGTNLNADANLNAGANLASKINSELGTKLDLGAGLTSKTDTETTSNLDTGVVLDFSGGLRTGLESDKSLNINTEQKDEEYSNSKNIYLNKEYDTKTEGNTVTILEKEMNEEPNSDSTSTETSRVTNEYTESETFSTESESFSTSNSEISTEPFSTETFSTESFSTETFSTSTEKLTESSNYTESFSTESFSTSTEKLTESSNYTESKTSTSNTTPISNFVTTTESYTTKINRDNTPFSRRRSSNVNGTIEVLPLNENNEQLFKNKEKEEKDIIRKLLLKDMNDAGYKHFDTPDLSHNTAEKEVVDDDNEMEMNEELADEAGVEVEEYDENSIIKSENTKLTKTTETPETTTKLDLSNMFDNSEIMTHSNFDVVNRNNSVQDLSTEKTDTTDMSNFYKDIFMTLVPKVNLIMKNMTIEEYNNIFDLNNKNDTLITFITKCYKVNNCFITMVLSSTASLIIVILFLILICACYGCKRSSRYNHYHKPSNRIYRSTTMNLNPKKNTKEEIPLV